MPVAVAASESAPPLRSPSAPVAGRCHPHCLALQSYGGTAARQMWCVVDEPCCSPAASVLHEVAPAVSASMRALSHAATYQHRSRFAGRRDPVWAQSQGYRTSQRSVWQTWASTGSAGASTAGHARTHQGVSTVTHSHAQHERASCNMAAHLPVPSRWAHALLGHELQARRLQSQPWSPGMWRRRCARVCGIRTALATMVTSVGGM